MAQANCRPKQLYIYIYSECEREDEIEGQKEMLLSIAITYLQIHIKREICIIQVGLFRYGLIYQDTMKIN